MSGDAVVVTDTLLKRRRLKPAQAVLIGYGVAVVAGTILLMLPISTVAKGGATIVEALFTAVSAVCITGLVVVDTAQHWSLFGHIVILILVQLGGFGVMTFASVVGLALARRFSLRSRLTAAAEVHSTGLSDVKSLLLGVLRISLIIEGCVAVVLTLQFAIVYGHSIGESIWLGVFHSVSAFNNAGFSLFSDGLKPFVSDPVISGTIAIAVIFGGLGFPVLMQLRRHIRSPLLWTMNTRLVLSGTVVLLLAGFAYVTILEWNNPETLGPLPWPSKLLAGFFQSTQTRSGGFNTVDVGSMDSATWIGMDILMFIGAGPASTAGGIKITTFGVLFFIILTELRGQGAVNIFGKRLSRAVHRQAITVALISVAVVGASTIALSLMTDFAFEHVLFESISAFATAGLSTGITAGLPIAGQLLLVVLMFVGRLGPITLASALALQDKRIHYELPKERPIIG